MSESSRLISDYILGNSSEDASDYLVERFIERIYGSFTKGADAEQLDIYVDERLAVELKTKPEDWLAAFYQVQHYRKRGQEFSAFCVIAHKFIGLWRINEIPEFAMDLVKNADAKISPNAIGRISARKTNKLHEREIIQSSIFCLTNNEMEGLFKEDLDIRIAEFIDALKKVEQRRQQINSKNFIQKIEYLKQFFLDPMEAIHCFYTILNYWDISSSVPEPPESNPNTLMVLGENGRKVSESFKVNPLYQTSFKNFIERNYIFTNEGSGINTDYYFSRFDEVIAKIKPEYTKQHGIFFTDYLLCKFALWFVHHYYENKLSEKYIIIDPAAGSGNLVTSWRGHLKHKIVSELEPDLLKIIERRMKADNEQIRMGFTIVPKTSTNEGLNFLDKTAEDYLLYLNKALSEDHNSLNKPIAFLLNPPYKNTDQIIDEEIRKKEDIKEYCVHDSIISITGEDAGRERYLAFLGQILKISILQVKDNPDFKPLIMIFTPTSWLVPRPAFADFRKEFDKYFKYEKGFMITGKEFFKINGRFPITFTIWKYNYKENGNNNVIKLLDYTDMTKEDLRKIKWESNLNDLDESALKVIRGKKSITLSNVLLSIKKWCSQTRYDFSRAPRGKEDRTVLHGGLPSGYKISGNRVFGIKDSQHVGFMDNITPVRVNMKKNDIRFKNQVKSVWFRLDTVFLNVNQTKCLSGPPDNRGYCAYDLDSAKKTFAWYAITKAVNGRYPTWANQLDIWAPEINSEVEKYFYSLCFAFCLANNSCVVTKFEENNPIDGAPEVIIDNPLSPNNADSFWSGTLDKEIIQEPALAFELVNIVKNVYNIWIKHYYLSRKESVGLENEPYFKHFSYPDYITPNSGLIQIKRCYEINPKQDLSIALEEMKKKSKFVLDEIYSILINKFDYFGKKV